MHGHDRSPASWDAKAVTTGRLTRNLSYYIRFHGVQYTGYVLELGGVDGP